MHKDKLKTSPTNKAYTNGLKNIDWSIGREEREAQEAKRKAANRKLAAAKYQHQIMPDIQPFIDPIDGNEITSRRQKREFMRKHDVIDVGNEKPRPPRRQALPPVSEDIKRALQELGG